MRNACNMHKRIRAVQFKDESFAWILRKGRKQELIKKSNKLFFRIAVQKDTIFIIILIEIRKNILKRDSGPHIIFFLFLKPLNSEFCVFPVPFFFFQGDMRASGVQSRHRNIFSKSAQSSEQFRNVNLGSCYLDGQPLRANESIIAFPFAGIFFFFFFFLFLFVFLF